MARGREVPPRGEGCRHTWAIVFEQGLMVVLECERCRAVVGCEVGHHDHGGHTFAFGVVRGTVLADELRALGEWFGRQVGEHHAVHMDMRPGRRHRRRAPAPAA